MQKFCFLYLYIYVNVMEKILCFLYVFYVVVLDFSYLGSGKYYDVVFFQDFCSLMIEGRML